MSDIDRVKAEAFIAGLPHAARGRFNIRMKFNQFLNYSVRQGWLTFNPAAEIEVRVSSDDEVFALSIDQTTKLLRAAEQSEDPAVVLPYLLVSLFSGLRPHEAMGLHWGQIHFETKQIEVLKRTSKVRETRFVQMEPMLMLWLLPYRKPEGRIIGANFRNLYKKVRVAAGLCGEEDNGWVKDTLRHTYGSFWLAQHKDRAHLAELMGTGLGMIKRHYRRVILPEVAKAYWALRPLKRRGRVVVPFAKAG